MYCPLLFRASRRMSWLILGLVLLSIPDLFAQQPVLRIETGSHNSTLRRVATDAANRWLVTAAEDKTARVWELSSGRLLRVLRVSLDSRDDDEGKLYSVAMTPDGETIAVGGWTKAGSGYHNVYLFDRATGRMTQRLPNFPNVILHLAYSPDGRYLAAVLGQANGVRVFDAQRGYALVGQDTAYKDNSNGAGFSSTGKLATTSYDGFLRLYSVGTGGVQLLAKQKIDAAEQPFGVAFSPDGTRVAIGYSDLPRVQVFSSRDLSLLYTPDVTGAENGGLSQVAWSADGRTLFAAGRWRTGGNYPIRAWASGGRGTYRDLTSGAQDTIQNLVSLNDGGIIFGASEPSFGVLDASGRRTLFNGQSISDYRGMLDNFRFSPDGSTFQFFYYDTNSLARFDLATRQLNLGAAPAGTVRAPVTASGSLTVTDWRDTYNPKLNGQALQLESYETSRSVAFAPDGQKFVLGAEYWMRLYDRTGKEIWRKAIPGVAWSVNITADGRWVTGAFGDGTIRWYNIADGQEQLAFFPHADRKRWVLWSPTGYYDASPGSESLIGWHINNGADAAGDFYPVGQFRATYYRPDVVNRVLSAGGEMAALQQANEETGRKQQATAIARQLPPVIDILSPSDNGEVTNQTVTVRYAVRNSNGEPMTALKVLLDGRPVNDERGRQIGLQATSGNSVQVTIPERDCEIALIAENRFAASVPAIVRVRWAGRGPVAGNGGAGGDAFVSKPKLYVLAVGVSKYANPDFSLGFAAKDARDFAAAWQQQKGKLYRDVQVKVLTDEQATRDEIVDGLDWITRETTSKDVAVVFFAGHGVNDQLNRYFYGPYGLDTDKLLRTGVAFSDIKGAVEAVAGKVLFFVDTCHSGNALGGAMTRTTAADMNGFVNELASAENGAVVFAASTGRQVSLEKKEWGNGAFTKAVLEGLSGRADFTGRGRITVNMLDVYISDRVKELTSGRQTPTTTKPNTVPDFPIIVP